MKIIAISQRIKKIVEYNEIRDQLDNRLNFFVIKAGYLPVPIPNFLGCEKKKNKCLLNWLKKKIPVLGICRGMQVINKFFGGTKVRINNHAGTRHKIYGNYCKSRDTVNSFHNWGFKLENLAGELKTNTLAKDKTIESFRHKKFNIYGIMWHPERERVFRKDDLLLMQHIFN